MTVRRFASCQTGASAAEFALVLPIFLLFLLGLIDAGRYMWAVNEAEKATQIGARWAVATDLVPTPLSTHSFVLNEPSNPVVQGEPVPSSKFPGVRCTGTSSGTTVTATCVCGVPGEPAGTCAFGVAPGTQGSAAFGSIVAKIRTIYPRVATNEVIVDYLNSGLGYAGDPNGADVAPFVRVSIVNQQFPLFFLLGRNVAMPEFSYGLTMEDGTGTKAYY